MGRGLGILFLIAVAAAGTACGGGGGGGGGGPTAPPPSIVVTPASTGAGIDIAPGAASTASTLALEIRATQVEALFAVAFDLTYPANLLSYQGAHAGSFLSADGTSVSTQVVQSSPGHLVVGLSRLGTVPGVSGSGLLVELDFQALAAGTGAFAFSNNSAYGATGSALVVPWNAGTVAVVR